MRQLYSRFCSIIMQNAFQCPTTLPPPVGARASVGAASHPRDSSKVGPPPSLSGKQDQPHQAQDTRSQARALPFNLPGLSFPTWKMGALDRFPLLLAAGGLQPAPRSASPSICELRGRREPRASWPWLEDGEPRVAVSPTFFNYSNNNRTLI